ncbi:MAG: Dabb family protein [Tannerella sp.]|jgi:heme-degrading monooxygenase HmoA|nr:Dabb family protein [Tannerella sp.]
MKRRHFIRNAAGATAIAAASVGMLGGCSASAPLKSGEIMHTVIFDLKYPVGSAEAGKFLADGYRILTGVPGVRDFQAYRQCSPKNDYQYGFLMTFDSQADFDAYTAHPDHGKFVKERWETEVTRFQESDFVRL